MSVTRRVNSGHAAMQLISRRALDRRLVSRYVDTRGEYDTRLSSGQETRPWVSFWVVNWRVDSG